MKPTVVTMSRDRPGLTKACALNGPPRTEARVHAWPPADHHSSAFVGPAHGWLLLEGEALLRTVDGYRWTAVGPVAI
jgi:hypothetical protein